MSSPAQRYKGKLSEVLDSEYREEVFLDSACEFCVVNFIVIGILILTVLASFAIALVFLKNPLKSFAHKR